MKKDKIDLTISEHDFKIVYDNFMDCLHKRNDSVEDFKTLMFQSFIADLAVKLKYTKNLEKFDYQAFLGHTFLSFSATLERIQMIREVKNELV